MKVLFAIALLFISSQVFADNTCGGNCPGNDCPYCPCGDKYAYQNITQLCANYSEWNQTCCQCVMSYESGGNSNALSYNSKNSSFEVGIFQIGDTYWDKCSGGSAPCDASSNLQCAINIWKEGNYSFKLWPSSSAEICGCTENEKVKPKPPAAAHSTNSTTSTNSTSPSKPSNSTQPSSSGSNPLSGLSKALSGLSKPSSKPSKGSSSKGSGSKPSSSKGSGSGSKGSSSPSSNSEDAFNWY